jgi:hypothetical protein
MVDDFVKPTNDILNVWPQKPQGLKGALVVLGTKELSEGYLGSVRGLGDRFLK